MSIVKHNQSPYWYIQFQFEGKTFVRSSRTKDKKLAEQIEAKWRSDIIKNDYIGIKDRITLSDALNGLVKTKTHIADKSNVHRYSRVIQRYLRGSTFIDAMTYKNVEQLFSDLKDYGYSLDSMKKIMGFLRQAVQYAVKLGYQVPALEYPKIPVPKHRLRYLTLEEEKQLLKAADPYRDIKGKYEYARRSSEFNFTQHQHYDFLVILLDTGARFSEIATLKWSAINFSQRSINLWRPKVRNESILYMTDRVYEILLRRKSESTTEYIFSNKVGGPMNHTTKSFRRIFKSAGLADASMHTLRHTHASRLVQAGLSVYDVKEVLGHTNIQTTLRYAHLDRNTVTKKAKDIMNLINQGQNLESSPITG